MAAGLAECAGLQVAQARRWAEAGRLLASQAPDVLIFDLTNVSESQILRLLFKNPGLLLIGMDPERNQAVLVSGQPIRAYTIEDLVQVIQRHDPDKAERG
jgi:hypothetical protein